MDWANFSFVLKNLNQLNGAYDKCLNEILSLVDFVKDDVNSGSILESHSVFYYSLLGLIAEYFHFNSEELKRIEVVNVIEASEVLLTAFLSFLNSNVDLSVTDKYYLVALILSLIGSQEDVSASFNGSFEHKLNEDEGFNSENASDRTLTSLGHYSLCEYLSILLNKQQLPDKFNDLSKKYKEEKRSTTFSVSIPYTRDIFLKELDISFSGFKHVDANLTTISDVETQKLFHNSNISYLQNDLNIKKLFEVLLSLGHYQRFNHFFTSVFNSGVLDEACFSSELEGCIKIMKSSGEYLTDMRMVKGIFKVLSIIGISSSMFDQLISFTCTYVLSSLSFVISNSVLTNQLVRTHLSLEENTIALSSNFMNSIHEIVSIAESLLAKNEVKSVVLKLIVCILEISAIEKLGILANIFFPNKELCKSLSSFLNKQNLLVAIHGFTILGEFINPNSSALQSPEARVRMLRNAIVNNDNLISVMLMMVYSAISTGFSMVHSSSVDKGNDFKEVHSVSDSEETGDSSGHEEDVLNVLFAENDSLLKRDTPAVSTEGEVISSKAQDVENKGFALFFKLSETIIDRLLTLVSKCDSDFTNCFTKSLNGKVLRTFASLIQEFERNSKRKAPCASAAATGLLLTQFIHNLISSSMLNRDLSLEFIHALDLYWNEDKSWPLFIHPISLGISVHILVNKSFEEILVSIWLSVLDQLSKAIIQGVSAQNFTDINVEHSQFLQIAFQQIDAKQCATIFNKFATCLIEFPNYLHIIKRTSPLPLARFIMLFEFCINSFTDFSVEIYSFLRSNVFDNQSIFLKSDSNFKQYFACSEVHQFIRRMEAEGPFTDPNPRYYDVTSKVQTPARIQRASARGLKFLFNCSENYNDIYSSLVAMLAAGSELCNELQSGSPSCLLDTSSVHYCFFMVWRLLGILPTSHHFITKTIRDVESLDISKFESFTILHLLRWIPRLASANYSRWTESLLTTDSSNEDLIQTLAFLKEKHLVLTMRLIVFMFAKHCDVLSKFTAENYKIKHVNFENILILDAIVTKSHSLIDELVSKSFFCVELLPIVARLLRLYLSFGRQYCLLEYVKQKKEIITVSSLTILDIALQSDFTFFQQILTSNNFSVQDDISAFCFQNSPKMQSILKLWTQSQIKEFEASIISLVKHSKFPIPSECNMENTVFGHFRSLSNYTSKFTDMAQLKHAIHSLIQFFMALSNWITVDALNSIDLDVTSVFLETQRSSLILEADRAALSKAFSSFSQKVFNEPIEKNPKVVETIVNSILRSCYDIILQHGKKDCEFSNEVFSKVCLSYFESSLFSMNVMISNLAISFLCSEGSVFDILMTICNESLPEKIVGSVLSFFLKILSEIDSKSNLSRVLYSITKFASIADEKLYSWLSRVVLLKPNSPEAIANHNLKVTKIAVLLIKNSNIIGNKIILRILSTLLTMCNDVLSLLSSDVSFTELMNVMKTLADANDGIGHFELFKYSLGFLSTISKFLLNKKEKFELLDKSNKEVQILNCILGYIINVIAVFTTESKFSNDSPKPETSVVFESTFNFDDGDVSDELDDSDDDSLNKKLCTFSVTQRDFMMQHWYHCHTCGMNDSVGVCSVCVKVCHKDHDVSYSKHGSFFCDCGAKGENVCLALKRRRLQVDQPISASTYEVNTMLNHDANVNCTKVEVVDDWKSSLQQILEPYKDDMMKLLSPEHCNLILNLLFELKSVILEHIENTSPVSAFKRLAKAYDEFHNCEKSCEVVDNIMVPAIGNQEGAFENVKLTFSGEHGQTIKQLMSAHMIKRVSMCVVSSNNNKRQHLVVAQDKGKITLLLLSVLLKQSNGKKKLNLTRLGSSPIPFTILNVDANPCKDDTLAVSGLKDCHILIFKSNGSIYNHITLNLGLETGNYIIKTLWIPGSQTELAVIAADYIKIYNLSKNISTPVYFYHLLSGKIRDTTFMINSDTKEITMFVISSQGYIYTQVLDEQSSLENGPFYVTNTVVIEHPDLKISNGQFAGGGVSIYYSHILQHLFFSYNCGKSYMSPLKSLEKFPNSTVLNVLHPIVFKSSNGNTKCSPLIQWNEVNGHPGLILCVNQLNGSPLVVMATPTSIHVQEIKHPSSKSKIQDMVAVKHLIGVSQKKTVLILLSEDGSIRMFNTNNDKTGYWLSPQFFPFQQSLKKISKSQSQISTNNQGSAKTSSNSTTFPVDFFEQCEELKDVEFGGNHFLQVYNVQQIKSRFASQSMYVATTQANVSCLEISNLSNNTVIVGLRIQLGAHSLERVPSYVEFLGRQIQISSTTLLTPRWYDLPLTREESILADKKLFFYIGPSVDPNNSVVFIDNICVYVKSKEAFGWQDDVGDEARPLTRQHSSYISDNEKEIMLKPFDTFLSRSLEMLSACFHTLKIEPNDTQRALAFASDLLATPLYGTISQQNTALLNSLHSSKVQCYKLCDEITLNNIVKDLHESITEDLFDRHIHSVKIIAQRRPINLIKFAETSESDFVTKMMHCVWSLYSRKGHIADHLICLTKQQRVALDGIVSSVVETLFTFSTFGNDDVAVRHLVDLLLYDNPSISFTTKSALLKLLLRPIPTLTKATTSLPPTNANEESSGAAPIMDAIDTTTFSEGHAAFETLMASSGQDIPVDEDAMMELAIALSLQAGDDQPQATEQGIVNESDEEGSTAATDGSTLAATGHASDSLSESSSGGVMTGANAANESTQGLTLTKSLLSYLPRLADVGGARSVPFLQVLLALTSDVEEILQKLLSHLELNEAAKDAVQRTPRRETQLLVMRLLCVFMSRGDTAARTTASLLRQRGALPFCLDVLTELSKYWAVAAVNAGKEQAVEQSTLIAQSPTSCPPDMSPFFLTQYVKSHASDVFAAYPQLLTEMVLRLPYHINRLSDGADKADNEKWVQLLAHYITNLPQVPFVKRQVRKLLLFICGSKEQYRKKRDLFIFESHFSVVRSMFSASSPITSYDDLHKIVENLKSACDCASSRAHNWQLYCCQDKSVLEFLMAASTLTTEETIHSLLVELISLALCGPAVTAKPIPTTEQTTTHASGRRERPSKKMKEYIALKPPVDGNEDSASISTVQNIDESLSEEFIVHLLHPDRISSWTSFMKSFLLQSNNANLRWQAHALIHKIWTKCSVELQGVLLKILWSLWPLVIQYGKRAVQFVDILGFITLKTPSNKKKNYLKAVVDTLTQHNEIILNHPNAILYEQLARYVEMEGFYLETSPCTICTNPETSYHTIKMASIKSDTKCTTTTQLIKFNSPHQIQRMTVRISDINSSKMVKSMTVHYNKRAVQSAIELKNNPGIWQRAKRQVLEPHQTEVRFDFPLPIVAVNWMLEFNEFYENYQVTAESLSCPRCSTAVAANPGICANCGENVYQCHKCRQINYDEREPFLCNSCGYCKYAKFEFTLLARPCCAVDPIDNEEERRRALTNINSLLDKADRAFRKLAAAKPLLEANLVRLSDGPDDTSPVTGPVFVHKSIQLLANKYGVDCKASFEEFSKQTEKVIATRKELTEYDYSQNNIPSKEAWHSISQESSTFSCFGCVLQAILHCLTLSKVLVASCDLQNQAPKLVLQLLSHNVRRGSSEMRTQARQLLFLVIRNNCKLNNYVTQSLLYRSVSLIKALSSSHDLVSAVHHDVSLLTQLATLQDTCWEVRLRSLLQLFFTAIQIPTQAVQIAVILPCLKSLQKLISSKSSNKSSPLSKNELCAWLTAKTAANEGAPITAQAESSTIKQSWVKLALFSRSSRQLRQATHEILVGLSVSSPESFTCLVNLLTGYLDELGEHGDTIGDFLSLYLLLIRNDSVKRDLASKGLIAHLAKLVSNEIHNIVVQESESRGANVSQGFALKALIDLLFAFSEVDDLRKAHRKQLIAPVLNGYLQLKKLVSQRTKLVDEAQDMLLSLLNLTTGGDETETRDFMSVCFDTLRAIPLDDRVTPVFVFERLCNTILPEDEGDVAEFFVSFEKDPQQEDFLLGRMQGNPYSSSEPGIGPLMRDLKNKICRDCELVALLEDDNGMELLVNNKIIGLDLPVKSVFRKVWCTDNSDTEPMKIVYRMRGLLGDATEEFISTLDMKTNENAEDEVVYKLASTLSQCGGLEVMLTRIASINCLSSSKPLLEVLLKLFSYAVKVEINRAQLILPSLNCLNVLLGVLNLALESVEMNIVEQVLQVMEAILQQAHSNEEESPELQVSGDAEQLKRILSYVSAQRLSLMKIVPYLTFGEGSVEKTKILLDFFLPHLDLEALDADPKSSTLYLDSFVVVAQHISPTIAGDRLKNCILESGIVSDAVKYIEDHTPPSGPVAGDSRAWKTFLSRKGLSFALRLLAAMCSRHPPSQQLVGKAVSTLHRLERVSSQEQVGSLAEALLETLRSSGLDETVDKVRSETRSQQRRLAMQVRKRQLGSLGLHLDQSDKVAAKFGLDELKEEAGLICCICREGYKYHPNKVLAIYTFTSRANLDAPFGSNQSRSTNSRTGYSTVSHFTVVHPECHTSAVRLHRTRDEWESAALQNSDVKCNGLLPVWGPQVPEPAFATYLAKFNSHLQESIGPHREPTYHTALHDLKLLMVRFADQRSFSDECGGGGRQSNARLIPYLIHIVLYVMNTTRCVARERRLLDTFIASTPDKLLTLAYDVDGCFYYLILALHVMPRSEWVEKYRMTALSHIISVAHIKELFPSGNATSIPEKSILNFSIYRPSLIFWALVDRLYELFSNVTVGESTWSVALADYIRHNDASMLDHIDNTFLEFYEEVLKVESFFEFCDVCGIINDLRTDAETYFKDVLHQLPQ